MKRGRLQAKDIPDRVFMQHLHRTSNPSTSIWTIAESLNVPFKLARAKAARLTGRGMFDACTCGCIGTVWSVADCSWCDSKGWLWDPIGESADPCEVCRDV